MDGPSLQSLGCLSLASACSDGSVSLLAGIWVGLLAGIRVDLRKIGVGLPINSLSALSSEVASRLTWILHCLGWTRTCKLHHLVPWLDLCVDCPLLTSCSLWGRAVPFCSIQVVPGLPGFPSQSIPKCPATLHSPMHIVRYLPFIVNFAPGEALMGGFPVTMHTLMIVSS